MENRIQHAFPWAFLLVNLPFCLIEKINARRPLNWIFDLLVEHGFPIKEVVPAFFENGERCLLFIFKEDVGLQHLTFNKAIELHRCFEYKLRGRKEWMEPIKEERTNTYGWLLTSLDARRVRMIGNPTSFGCWVHHATIVDAIRNADAATNTLAHPEKRDIVSELDQAFWWGL